MNRIQVTVLRARPEAGTAKPAYTSDTLSSIANGGEGRGEEAPAFSVFFVPPATTKLIPPQGAGLIGQAVR